MACGIPTQSPNEVPYMLFDYSDWTKTKAEHGIDVGYPMLV
jgi:hypothetical protein